MTLRGLVLQTPGRVFWPVLLAVGALALVAVLAIDAQAQVDACRDECQARAEGCRQAVAYADVRAECDSYEAECAAGCEEAP